MFAEWGLLIYVKETFPVLFAGSLAITGGAIIGAVVYLPALKAKRSHRLTLEKRMDKMQ